MTKLYGKGTLTELVKGKKYRIHFSCGKDPVTGKYRQTTETFIGTKRQAELRIEEIRREAEQGKLLNADKITLAEWMESYLSTREQMGKLRPKTLLRDRVLSKHIVRGLGAVRVVDITPAMVNSFNANLRKNGIGDTTVKQCHRLLKTVLKQAVNNDIILRNPVERAESPKNPVPNRQSLEPDEATRLARLCTSGTPSANKTAVYLALATGARLGEILGLTWSHIDMNNGRPYAYIVQQFTAASELTPLKTDKDENPVGRVVPLDGSTVDVLMAWKQVQKEQLNALGIEQGSDTAIVTNQLGTFTNHSRFERWWRSFCVDNGFGRMVDTDGRKVVSLTIGEDAALFDGCTIEWKDANGWPCDESGRRYSRSYPRPKLKLRYDGLHFHALRHTHFSLRLASGMDTITAQYLGGWKSPAMLMNVYAHPVTENIWKSAGFMDELTAKTTA